MTELDATQLRQLCGALGWQGGTFHQVLEEVNRLAQAQPARTLTSAELADCCGGCRTNSAIDTWMQRAIAKFCDVNGIRMNHEGVPPSSGGQG